jgi:hypothetical protein
MVIPGGKALNVSTFYQDLDGGHAGSCTSTFCNYYSEFDIPNITSKYNAFNEIRMKLS